MTTITPLPTDPRSHSRRSSRRGFTLVEIMISTALTMLIGAATLSTVLMFGRQGATVTNYIDMEGQARRGLELFGQDARMASAIVWNSAQSLTLTIPTSSGTATYIFAYDAANKQFTRQLVGGATEVLIKSVDSLSFSGYKITGDPVDLSNLVLAANNTKQIQLTLKASRSTTTVVTATHTVLSARFILRNKKVTA